MLLFRPVDFMFFNAVSSSCSRPDRWISQLKSASSQLSGDPCVLFHMKLRWLSGSTEVWHKEHHTKLLGSGQNSKRKTFWLGTNSSTTSTLTANEETKTQPYIYLPLYFSHICCASLILSYELTCWATSWCLELGELVAGVKKYSTTILITVATR